MDDADALDMRKPEEPFNWLREAAGHLVFLDAGGQPIGLVFAINLRTLEGIRYETTRRPLVEVPFQAAAVAFIDSTPDGWIDNYRRHCPVLEHVPRLSELVAARAGA